MKKMTLSEKRKTIDNYINKRYQGWLDYSTFQCSNSGLEGHEHDLLHEVIISLMKKDVEDLLELFSKERDGFRELDFFVLRMIKLNATSNTAPYRHREKVRLTSSMKDLNVDVYKLNIIDDEYIENDQSQDVLLKFNKIREILEELDFSQKEKDIFRYKIIQDNDLTTWPGPETPGQVYFIFKKVKTEIINQIRKYSNCNSIA